MAAAQSPGKIKEVAMELDNALEARDMKKLLDCFSDDCEIEVLGVKLAGKEGVEKWINWLFKHVEEMVLTPRVIMVEGNVFFEEFIVEATLHNGMQKTE